MPPGPRPSSAAVRDAREAQRRQRAGLVERQQLRVLVEAGGQAHLGGSPPFLMSSDRTPLIIGGDSAGHGCILYALVSRGSTILAKESLGSRRKAVGGNFATVA